MKWCADAGAERHVSLPFCSWHVTCQMTVYTNILTPSNQAIPGSGEDRGTHDSHTLRLTQRLAQLCMACLLILLSACASDPKMGDMQSIPPPGVRLGNEITLLDATTEKVAAHMTPDGRVHLVAITTNNEAFHVVVSAQGVEQKEKIRSGTFSNFLNIAIANDARDRLHVAFVDEHWILDKGTWHLVSADFV